MDTDKILVITSVLAAAYYLLRRKLRAQKARSCGGGCECPKPVRR